MGTQNSKGRGLPRSCIQEGTQRGSEPRLHCALHLASSMAFGLSQGHSWGERGTERKLGQARGSRGWRGTTRAGRGRAESERGQRLRIAVGDRSGDCRCCQKETSGWAPGARGLGLGRWGGSADPGSPHIAGGAAQKPQTVGMLLREEGISLLTLYRHTHCLYLL